ncbi:hypothetical protein EOE66_13010 [Rubrivivax rivuli]|uniref:Uncharacterized protein n=1 Tax=Rubrivivax rivuli TaxID=1862385 RepID=A0A437RE89_9BURK|nr:hypothetical protein EOE66_13010 [Rubrivivax rivuli]
MKLSRTSFARLRVASGACASARPSGGSIGFAALGATLLFVGLAAGAALVSAWRGAALRAALEAGLAAGLTAAFAAAFGAAFAAGLERRVRGEGAAAAAAGAGAGAGASTCAGASTAFSVAATGSFVVSMRISSGNKVNHLYLKTRGDGPAESGQRLRTSAARDRGR